MEYLQAKEIFNNPETKIKSVKVKSIHPLSGIKLTFDCVKERTE